MLSMQMPKFEEGKLVVMERPWSHIYKIVIESFGNYIMNTVCSGRNVLMPSEAVIAYEDKRCPTPVCPNCLENWSIVEDNIERYFDEV